MASNRMDVLERLRLYCHTFEDLDLYVQEHGIDINDAAVTTRRNELFANDLISDTDMYRFLLFCCHTMDHLIELTQQHGLDINDPAVRARRRDLQV